MGQTPAFGEKKLTKACKLLGFIIYKNRGKGGHKLAKHPTRKPSSPRQYPHITIQCGKEIRSLDYRQTIIREIMQFGFTKEQVYLALKGKSKILKRILR